MAKRTAEGIEIINTSIFDTAKGPTTVELTRTFALSTDGKMLNVNVTVQGATVNSKTKFAFNKK